MKNKALPAKQLIANKIKAEMLRRDINRVELAKLMDTTPSAVTRWLCGSHNFQVDTLFQLEEVLDITIFNWSSPL
jgi:transcriptional regulator with XRE-family HTH domain